MSNKNNPANPTPMVIDTHGSITSLGDAIGQRQGIGLTKLEHASIEMMKAIIIGNNADSSVLLGKGSCLDAINVAETLLSELDKNNF